MGCLLAVDAGTTGLRTLAVDESGAVVDLAYRPLTQHFPRPGWVEHDASEIWDLVASTLAEVAGRCTERGVAVAAVGITNQRETAIAWDRRTGAPVHRAIVWQDRRTAGRCEELMEAGHLPLVRDRTGLVLDPYFSATKFEWLLGEGGVRAGPDTAFGTVDAWLLWQLSGGDLFATDATNASRTMLYDIRARRWTPELCDLLRVPIGSLPELRPSCGRLTTVGGDLATAVPALRGVPVSGVAGDQQAALFGQACTSPGLAKVTYGTGSFVLVNAGDMAPPPSEGVLSTVAWDLGDHARSPGLHEKRPDHGLPSVTYALEGSTFVAGAAIQWLRDELGLIERAEDVGPLAESVSDSAGCVVVPAFAGLGSPWWDPRARGVVTGITRGTERSHLARAVVEAIAFGVRDMVDAIAKALGNPISQLRADGGASAMRLLLQLQADQLQIPVVRPRCVESTALGAAMFAGLAEGVWDADDLAALWEADLECVPRVDRAAADTAYGAWLRAVDRARNWDREG